MSQNTPLSQKNDSADPTSATVSSPIAQNKAGTSAPVEPTSPNVSDPDVESGKSPADLEKKLAEQTAKAAEYWDKLLRTTADFENFKKRVAKERAESTKYASAPLLRNLLTILDNFEMALAAAGDSQEQSVLSLRTGVAMIYQQLKQTLEDAGLTEIDAQGQVFDPSVHEAVSQHETVAVPEGHVAHQLRKGYRLHDRLLRAASVVVGKSPASSENTPKTPTGESADQQPSD